MEAKLKNSYYVEVGGKAISELGWTSASENEKYIILVDYEVRKAVACYDKESGKRTILVKNIHGCSLTKHGIIIGTYSHNENGEEVKKYGFITYDGIVRIPFKFSYVHKPFHYDDLLFVQDGNTCSIYDYMGNKKFETNYPHFSEKVNCIIFGKHEGIDKPSRKDCYGVYFVKTGIIIEPEYNCVEVKKECVIISNINKDYGAYTLDGEEIIPCEMDSIVVEHNGDKSFLRAYKRKDGLIANGLYSLPDGKCIIPLENSRIERSYRGLEVIDNWSKLTKLYSYEGEQILPGEYELIEYIGTSTFLTKMNDEYKIFTRPISSEIYDELIHSGKYESVSIHGDDDFKYCKIVLHGSKKVFLYVPWKGMFVPGIDIKPHYNHRGGFVEYCDYCDADNNWRRLPESMYLNGRKIKSLYDYKGE